MTKKPEASVKAITPEEAQQLGPEEIIINNARTLVHSDLEHTKELIVKSFDYMKDLMDKAEEDFRKDPKAVICMQLQLSSLSLATEYWIEKIKKGKIKVYSPADMPKA